MWERVISLFFSFWFWVWGVVRGACLEMLLEILLTFTLLKLGSGVSHTHLNWHFPESYTLPNCYLEGPTQHLISESTGEGPGRIRACMPAGVILPLTV
jgi:hypothetical protein